MFFYRIYTNFLYLTEIKWQLFTKNLFDSKLTVLEQEDESSYPNYSILFQQYSEKIQNFLCKIEVPSKKHPAIFYSNSMAIQKLVISVTHSKELQHVDQGWVEVSRCYISANMIITKPYNVMLVDSAGNILETKTSSNGNFSFLIISIFDL